METLQAVGRRKASVARVYFFPKAKGKNSFIINKKPLKEYFIDRKDMVRSILSPLKYLGFEGTYNIKVTVHGGGKKGQAEAIRLGLSRTLSQMDEQSRKKLRSRGFLTRDPRVVERKKPGRRKARKKEQYSKR
ncbi:MAG: 30S ribosomal protein S9 [Elusimicrobiota bacterium]